MQRIKHRVLVKHIPQRTCIACRKVKPQRELVRLVCISGGNVEVDITGKKAGRGAYLCRRRECWEIGLKGSRLEHALRTSIARDDREQLARYEEEFLQEVNQCQG